MRRASFNRRDFIRVGGAGLTFPLLAGFSQRPDDGRLADAHRQAQQFVKDGVPSLSVAVFHHGHPLWIEAFGWADRERGVLALPATPYAIASASKPFTGMAVAQLVVAGRLRLDEPIENYLGGVFPPSRDTAPVTVRQALQHRSGIPRHWRNFFVGQGEPPPFASVLRDHGFTTSAHGKRYLYSNINYGLLATAVETVAGQPFHHHLRKTLLRPLGLSTATSLVWHFGDWRAAIPYEEDGTPIPPYLVDEMGARDLIMSASDLARFGLGHLDGRLRNAGALMLNERAPLAANGVSRASYGLGWIVEEESPAALFSYGHTGEGPGGAASLTIVPGEKLVVATMANQQGPAAYILNEIIIDAMSPEFASRRKAHPFADTPHDADALRTLKGRWEGKMESAAGSHTVSIVLGDNSASAIIGEQRSALTNLAVRNGVMTGRAGLSVPTDEANRWPHETRLTLEPAGARLDGTLSAYASRGRNPHDQFWLSYPLSLRRA